MALTVRATVEQNDNGTLLRITDTTGIYSLTNNPNGYGAPNPEWADATAITLTFEKMDEDSVFTTEATEDIFPMIIPVDYFSLQEPYELALTLSDGWYNITYTVTIDAVDYEYVIEKAFYADIRCCYKNKALAAAGCKCNCKDKIMALLELKVNIDAIQAASDADNGLAVIDALEAAALQCSNCGCS